MNVAGKTYWLVGASEGLGEALALKLAAEGAHIVLSARSEDKLAALAAKIPNACIAPLDVTDKPSVVAAAASVGPLNGVIYLAGYYDPMKAQSWNAEAVEQMCAVNFTGALHVLGQTVPAFVAKDAGHIVLIGSLAGYRGLPGSIGYGASKAALMHMGETLYADLHKTGVKVQNINPGFIKTRLTAKNKFNMPQLMTPEEAADHVIKAMKSKRFETAFPKPFGWLFSLARFTPRALWLKLFNKV